ncbi:MAG: RIP metalloprotease RseP [Candidatus Omnitrophota bacterium]
MTLIIIFIVFGVLIVIHELGHLVAAKRAGIAVEAFSLGMGRRLFGVKIGETDYRVSMIPFGGFCQMAGEDPGSAKGKEYEFGSKPVGYRFWVVAAGSITNYIFAFILFSVIFMIGVPTLMPEVGEVLKGYPAETSGIEAGDKILTVNGRKMEYWDDIVDAISKGSAGGAALEMEIKRGNGIINVDVKPDILKVTNIFGQTISRPMIGIAPRSEVIPVSYNPLQAVYQGGKRLLVLTGMTYKGIWLIVTGGMPLKTSVSGPIGIGRMIGQAAQMGFVPLLIITAHISMALAVFNLLPFPVLDGGHIIFLAAEKLRGKPLSLKVQEFVTQIALVMLISFAVFISWQDIKKFTPFGEKISKDQHTESPVGK